MEYYQKALVIYQEVYGEHHTAVVSILKEMGDVYLSQKDYARAMECYEEALSILKEVYGERHQDVALLLYSLGGGMLNRRITRGLWTTSARRWIWAGSFTVRNTRGWRES